MTVSRIEAKLDRIEMRIPDQRSLPQGKKMVTPPLPAEYFTGRDEYLGTMEDNFELPKTSVELRRQRRFVLYGTGGMGKTQLALKFLDVYGDRYAN